MGVIWTSRTRDRQPRGEARVNCQLPVTHLWSGGQIGSSGVREFARGINGTKGTLVAGQGYSWESYGDERVLNFDTSVGGTHSQIINLGDSSGSGGPINLNNFTLFMEFMLPSISQAVFYSSQGGGLQFSVESGGILNLVKSNTAVIGVATAAIATTNVWHKASVSWDGTNYRFVLNGVPAGSGANAQTLSRVQQYFGGLVSGVSFGCPPNGSKLKTFAIVGKASSVGEMVALHRNPWQLFAPERTPVFYSISGAPSSAIIASYRMRRPGLSRIWR